LPDFDPAGGYIDENNHKDKMVHIKIYEDFTSDINESTTSLESGGDFDHFDHFGKILKPLMDNAGFKWVAEKPQYGQAAGYADGYYCYPDHNGINLFLDKSIANPWQYVVYGKNNKGIKKFGWPNGTDAEVKKAATDAANYAMQLKGQTYGFVGGVDSKIINKK
jgi:hypothetical protein